MILLFSYTVQLKSANDELTKLQAAKKYEQEQRKIVEEKLRKVKDDRERQAAALNETTRLAMRVVSTKAIVVFNNSEAPVLIWSFIIRLRLLYYNLKAVAIT